MTDIRIATPITIHRPYLPRLHFPRLGIVESLGNVSGLLGDALLLATGGYYSGLCRQPRIFSEDDLEGRDPRW